MRVGSPCTGPGLHQVFTEYSLRSPKMLPLLPARGACGSVRVFQDPPLSRRAGAPGLLLPGGRLMLPLVPLEP